MRTSVSHPLQIAAIGVPAGGRIGVTFCPGKVQPGSMTGGWRRDLALDLDAIATWGATAVVTLLEDHEIDALHVPQIGAEVAARHMDWLHLPIPDVSTPDTTFEALWALAGEALRDRLRSGFDILVHCKGGLGRAGMVAARLLAELGVAPDQAVAKVRVARPGAIETEAQLTHVLSVQILPEKAPETSLAAARDRAIGALLGLAAGDALGTTLEFCRRDAKPRVTDLVGGGPFGLRPGEWTDDTAMALALGESLLAEPALEAADLMHRFTDWYRTGTYSCTGRCFDIGITTRQAIARWQASGDPMAGSADPMAAGNGSLMRLAPVAIRHWQDRPALRETAARQSRTTHGAAEAIEACVAFAEILADAIQGLPRSQVLRDRGPRYCGAIGPILAGSWRGKQRCKVNASGYVAHSLEASLWSIGRTKGFGPAVILAANLGEDADTTAAITGQLAGAIHGAEGIPAAWRRRLAWSDRITALAGALFDAGVEASG